MSATLAISGQFLKAEAPRDYVDRQSGEKKTSTRRTVVVLVDATSRTLECDAHTDMALPDGSGVPVDIVVTVGARVVNFGKSAEPTFELRSITQQKSAKQRAA